MILSAVNICYDPIHQPFASEGAVKIQNLNSERAALKIIRAVLRESDIDPQDAVNYSIHRCYCSFKIKVEDDDEDETFNPELTLDELEIKDGDSVFIRRIDDRVDEQVDEMEEEDSTLRRSSRKRKERDYTEGDDDGGPLNSVALSSSRRRRPTSNPSNTPAALDEVSSNLENLSPKAAMAARSISKLLGGEGWMTQSIESLGAVQARSHPSLGALQRAVKTSLQIPQVAKSEAGLFNTDLVEALTRAYHQRTSGCSSKNGAKYFWNLGPSDYERANEFLKGKIEQDGSWERSGISHLDETAVSKPASRFPLSDSGLSGQLLSTTRTICVLWNSEKWIKQAPLPGLSPISLKNNSRIAILRQIAQLTRVKPGEVSPDGIPPIALQALKESIKKNKEAFDSNNRGSKGGWAQDRNLKDALAVLKKRVASTTTNSSSFASHSSQASGSRTDGERQVRRRLDDGN